MCGIAGIAGYEGKDLTELLNAATSCLAHRGPDAAGVKVFPRVGVGLGHRRLSIIDLSATGLQPMSDEEQAVWIVYNGETYNYPELRKELASLGHQFRSQSDTEVVLHAYLQWGDDHTRRLRGMFAYAIADFRTNPEQPRVLLVRDRLGIKPLHYAWDGRRLAFASEIKSLLRLPWIKRDLDFGAVSDFLTSLNVPAPRTIYRAIQKIEPATRLVFDGETLTSTCFWDITFNDNHKMLHSDAVEETARLLEEAVELHTVSDVPVGSFLSGGVDSSTVTALMAKGRESAVSTFSIGFDVESHTETPFARLVAERYKTDHHERTVRAGSMAEMLERVVDAYDEPFADGSAIPTYEVSSLASDRLKVVLSGDGGDEVFGGYLWYETWRRRQPWARISAGPLAPFFKRIAAATPGYRAQRVISYMGHQPVERYGRMLSLFTSHEKEEIAGPLLKESVGDEYDDYWHLRPHWRPDLDPLTQAQYLDLKTYLPNDILTKVDRASMAHSLEVRPPLLDHVLVEYVFSLPVHIRFAGGGLKSLLRAAVRGLVPEPVLHRGKKGFSSPLGDWLREESQWARRFIAEGRAISEGLLNPGVVAAAGRGAVGPRFWALLVLERWFQRETA
jgi:asparagine synthase (glutamine-hydrolysing)